MGNICLNLYNKRYGDRDIYDLKQAIDEMDECKYFVKLYTRIFVAILIFIVLFFLYFCCSIKNVSKELKTNKGSYILLECGSSAQCVKCKTGCILDQRVKAHSSGFLCLVCLKKRRKKNK